MQQPLLEFVKAELASLKQADWLEVSKATGVPIGTIRKIHYGEVSDPRIGTIQPLFDHFKSLKVVKRKQARAS